MTDPRVLYLDLSQRGGGATTRGVQLLRALPADRVVLAALADSAIASGTTDVAIEKLSVGRHKLDPAIAWRLVRAVRRYRIDVIDAQNPQSYVWGAIAARLAGIALVCTWNSWPVREHGGSLRGQLYRLTERITRGLQPRHIVVAEEIRAGLCADGVDADRISVIPNAVNVSPDAITPDREWLERVFGLPRDATVFCAIGRLVPAKGYATLIDAFATAVRATPALHGVIVGDGPLRAPLQSRIDAAGLSARLKLVGEHSHADALRILKSSDFFVLSSDTEAMPMVVIEAAALARPIVATTVGEIPRMLTHEQSALLVAPGNASAMAAAIQRLAGQPALATALANAASATVMSRFRPEQMLDAVLAVYGRAALRTPA